MMLDREQARRRRKASAFSVAGRDGRQRTTQVAEAEAEAAAEVKVQVSDAETTAEGYRKVLGCRTRSDPTPVD